MLQLIKSAYAQSAVPTGLPNTWNNTALQNLTFCNVLYMALQVVFWAGVILASAFIAIGGIKYMGSQGDPKATDAARKTLTNAVIGFIIVIAARAIQYIAARMLTGTGDLNSGTCNF